MRMVLLGLVVLGVTGCNVSSTNPLDVVTGSEVDPTPYLGTWQVTEVDGEAPPQAMLVDLGETTEGVSFIIGGNESAQGRLTTIGNDVFASVDSPTGSWDIVKVSLEDEGDTLVLRLMDENLVQQDVTSGVGVGSLLVIDANTQVVQLEATGSELRSYISGRPTLFTGGVVRLVRSP